MNLCLLINNNQIILAFFLRLEIISQFHEKNWKLHLIIIIIYFEQPFSVNNHSKDIVIEK